MLQHFMGTQFKIVSFFFFFFFFYSVLANNQIKLNPTLEHKALLDLRSSLGIRAKHWPRKSEPCTNWTGIQCNNGRVVAIKLTGLRRSHQGNLSPQFAVDSLANFTHLTSFNSSGFILPGPIPDWFGQRLTQLKQLDLSSSSVLGSLPPSLGRLSNLDFLSLFNNSITGTVPMELGNLSSLRFLDLSWNSLTGSIPSSLADIVSLMFLDLSSNFLSGSIPVEFGSFLGLRLLNLSNNSLSSAIPAQISNLSQLVELDLGYNYLSGSLPEELSRLRNLTTLLVGNNELEGALSDTMLSNLSVLEYINLSSNRFQGEIPDVLWSLSHLRILDISGNNFTGVISGFNATGASYNLSNNIFFGNVTFDIRSFQSIDLSNNYFQGLAPRKSGVQVTDNCFTGSLNQRSSEDCSEFYADRGLVFVNDRSQTPTQRHSKHGHTRLLIMVGVFGGVGVLLLLALVLLLFFKICYRGNSNERGISNVSPVGEGGNNKAPVKFPSNISGSIESFTYEQILQATSNFDETNLIKNGHTGDIFRGILESGGATVVIKKVNVLHSEKETYKLELELLNWTTHHRLVPFLGHCLDHENEKFLVYKHMPNGDLFSLLSRDTDLEDENGQSLDWITRLKIATGTAEALVYLHHECNPPLVHRDIQASSILLDDKFEVRLGSLSDVCAQESDSQNLITKFFRAPKNPEGDPAGSSFTSCSYDVYCFGKVLLELVTGKVVVRHSDDASMKEWLDTLLPFITIREKELVAKIVDPSLIIHDDLLEEMWAVAIVAKACLHPMPSRRPEMRRVLKALENPFKVVREGSLSSRMLRNTSSRRSWGAAFLGSWHHSSQDSTNATTGQTSKEGGMMSLKQTGRVGSHSHSSGNEHSSSCKRSSSEIFPEPQDTLDIERQDSS